LSADIFQLLPDFLSQYSGLTSGWRWLILRQGGPARPPGHKLGHHHPRSHESSDQKTSKRLMPAS
jgi:hypothetical protein